MRATAPRTAGSHREQQLRSRVFVHRRQYSVSVDIAKRSRAKAATAHGIRSRNFTGGLDHARYCAAVSDPVAIYAAAVSSASVAWQVYSWRAARANRVRVDLINQPIRVVGDSDAPGVYVRARNLGSQPIRVQRAGIQVTVDARTEVFYAYPNRGTLLSEKVPPNDSAVTWMTADEQDDLDPNHAGTYVGWVELASGEICKTGRLSVIPRPVDENGLFLPERF